MTLSNIAFMFGALPLFLLLYYLSKPKYRIYEILIFSIWFYYVNDAERLKFLIILTVANYLVSLIIYHSSTIIRKIALLIGIIGNLSVLFLYKYLYFSISVLNQFTNYNVQVKEREMMVGLSFLAFTLISYLVDVYRKDVEAAKNPIKFADYVIMFPKILMGPIVRFSEVSFALDNTTLQPHDIGDGAKRFLEGFFKKVIVADNLALLVSQINSSADFSKSTVYSLWIGSIAYSLQLLYDFSGYSDMAIGLAEMMGFKFKENFDYPYCCNSFTDFWRRWHISLSEWFRDYVYIPLGGSRRSIFRNICNLLLVWLLTGIWHGAGYSFVVWGLIYFVMLMIERYIIKPKRLNRFCGVVWRIVTLLIVNFNWVIFSHDRIKDGIRYCLGMTRVYYHNPIFSSMDIRYIREFGLYIIIGLIFSTPVGKLVFNKINQYKCISNVMAIALPVVYLAIFIWALSFLMIGYHNPFLYQQF